MRFSLKWMLAAVALVGFGCVALYNANEAWAGAAMGLTTFVLLVALVGACHSNSRAFYTGACIFGWGYLILNYVPPMHESIRPLAAMDALLDIVYEPMQRDVTVDTNALNIDPHIWLKTNSHVEVSFISGPTGVIYIYRMPIQKHFRAIGHSLFALIFAIIGGAVGQCFSRGAKCDSH